MVATSKSDVGRETIRMSPRDERLIAEMRAKLVAYPADPAFLAALTQRRHAAAVKAGVRCPKHFRCSICDAARAALAKAKHPVSSPADRAQSAGTPTQTATLPLVTFEKYESDKRDDARHGGQT